MSGVRVVLLHPAWKFSCRTCIRYMVTSEAVFRRGPTGEVELRPPGSPTPCSACPKPPTWAKEAGKDWEELRSLAHELTDQNRAAVAFYNRCKATASFPADPLVRWYAGLIREAEDDAARVGADRIEKNGRELTEAVIVTLKVMASRGRH